MDTNTEKGISLVIFFFITIVAGTIPILIFSQCQRRLSSRRGQTIMSLLTCFAGGVFLATCLLNLLVEGFEQYEGFKVLADFDNEYPFFHLAIGLGLFIVALIERLAVVLTRTAGNSSSARDEEDNAENHNGVLTQSVGNGKIDADPGTKIEVTRTSKNVYVDSSEGNNSQPNNCADNRNVYAEQIVQSSTDRANTQMGEVNRVKAVSISGQTGVKAIIILLALSFHTIFDGLAVGLQETDSNIWTTTVAISIHKTIVAISLGLELAAAMSAKPWKAFLLLLLFALMAPIGVGIGMGITSDRVDSRAHLLAGGLMQGVATGSFLYVTFFEVLGEELGHHHSTIIKILFTVLGFGAMAVAKIWDTD